MRLAEIHQRPRLANPLIRYVCKVGGLRDKHLCVTGLPGITQSRLKATKSLRVLSCIKQKAA
jgi:hypothetical protein